MTGRFLIDEDFLRARGVKDFAQYRFSNSDDELALDIFLD
jgi:citronellol/citronellal dehydrogenase